MTWFEAMTGLAYKYFEKQVLHACMLKPVLSCTIPGSEAPPRCVSEMQLLLELPLIKSGWAQADCAIIEAGLGGEKDATNITHPGNVSLSIITSLGLEHQDVLGDPLSLHRDSCCKLSCQTCLADDEDQPEEVAGHAKCSHRRATASSGGCLWQGRGSGQ